MTNDLTRLVVLILAIVILLPMLMMLLVWPMGGMWDGGHMWDNGSTWGGLVAWAVIMLVLLVAVGVLIRWFTRADQTDDDPALEALRVAYARGEFSDEEFERRRERLE